MNLKTVLPWMIAAFAVALSVFTSTRPAPQPVQQPLPPEVAFPIVKASATPAPAASAGLSAEQMRQLVRDVLRDELPQGHAADGGSKIEEPMDEAQREERALQVEDGLMLVDDLVELGTVEQEDIMDLRLALSEMGREQGEQVLSAYFNALNNGDIVVIGAPL